MQFNEVKVKAVDKSVSQLRANMEQSGGRSVPTSRMSGNTAQPTDQPQGAVAAAAVKPVLDTLSQALVNRLQGQDVLRSLEGRKDAIVAFVEEQMADVSAELVTSVFQDLQTKCCSTVVNTMHASPREFWIFLSTFLPALAANHGEGRSAALATFMVAIGSKAVEKDPRGTWEMFVDFGLTKAAALLKKSKAGRTAVLQVMYSFCPSEIAPHIAAIKALQDALNDQHIFMQCLATLVTLENSFDEDMLDLYLYYCVLGLGMPSQQLRAACLSILPIAANQNAELVLAKLDLLEQSGKTQWWEVHAQLVVVYATLLELIDRDHEKAEKIYDLLNGSMTKCTTTDVLKIALCHLAPSLQSHPKLISIYAKALLDIPGIALSGSEGQSGLLNDSGIHALSVPTDMPSNHYRLMSLPSEWHSSSVAAGVAAEIQARGKQGHLVNLSTQHLDILYACLQNGVNVDDQGIWANVVDSITDFLYVALCDAEVFTVAIKVLRELFFHLEPTTMVQTFGTMMKSLGLLYPNGDDACKAAVGELLGTLVAMEVYGEELVTALKALPDEVRSVPEISALLKQ